MRESEKEERSFWPQWPEQVQAKAGALPHELQEPKYWAVFRCFPRYIIREQSQKWNSWGMNQSPHRMQVLQALALSATS